MDLAASYSRFASTKSWDSKARSTASSRRSFTIARNTALTLFHRRRIYSETPVNELPGWRVLEGGPDAAQALAARERIELMSEAIAQLPDRCREVMCLAALRGRSNAEIARELRLSESTVRVQLARGIRKCASTLREKGERP